MTSFVYFIQGERMRLIKIGVAQDALRRLADLQVGSPDRLRLLGVQDGGYDVESSLHARFRASRRHGEWFAPSKGLLAYIAACATPLARPVPAPVPAVRPPTAAERIDVVRERFEVWASETSDKPDALTAAECKIIFGLPVRDTVDLVRYDRVAWRRREDDEGLIDVASLGAYLRANC